MSLGHWGNRAECDPGTRHITLAKDAGRANDMAPSLRFVLAQARIARFFKRAIHGPMHHEAPRVIG
jgi:hypothetical protein